MPELPQERSRWLEVSLTLDNELAEAVAEVLSRFVSNGVVVENDMIYNDAEDRGTPVGRARVYGYLPVDEYLEEKRKRIEVALWHLSQIQALPEPTFRTIADDDWMSSWKKHYHPIQVGERLLILPAWIEHHESDRLAVRIDPSMAFGTGTHPSTQLSMQMIECSITPGKPMIDIGCGSGILSIAALHLGASHVLAVDTDYTAVRSTNENADNNNVLERLETGQGSVAEILGGNYSIHEAPLVVANILAPIILRLLEDGLARLVTPSGTLVLSGILAEQSDNVIINTEKQGLHLSETRQIGDWVALAFQRPAES
ncbi:MAG: 50S ribosomal protein L11 methyltransferase [Anaerolineaceae bacterium]|nr:50S ribosomal protein L11 methyltransferase [Anaerolineaceae bacterium]